MELLVLGAGLQGSACAFDLLQDPEVQLVRLADRNPGTLPAFLAPYEHQRLEVVRLDAQDDNAVRRLMERATAAMNALPYYLNLPMTKAAIDVGTPLCDLGGNTEIVFQQRELDAQADRQGVTIVPDCGLAPGMVNIIAAEGIRRFEHVEAVKIYVGGLPQNPEPPLNYQIVYSLEGALDYYTTPSWILRNGKPMQVDALSDLEEVIFPEPVGRLEAFHTGGGISTLPWAFAGRVQSMEYKTLRYPGHVDIIRPIRELGLLSDQPVAIDGAEVTPRDVFISVVSPKLMNPQGRDFVALRVQVRGSGNPAGDSVTWEMIDFFDEEREMSAMMRTTGFSLSITGLTLARGGLTTGVKTPDQVMPFAHYVGELGQRGIQIRSAD